jgi:hypothetical protein
VTWVVRDAPKRFVCSINWHVMQRACESAGFKCGGGQHALREEPPPIATKALPGAVVGAGEVELHTPYTGGAVLSYVRLPD